MSHVDWNAYESAVEDVVGGSAVRAMTYLQEALSQEGSGTHHLMNPHRSSAPGEYPALQYGNLRDSINFEQEAYNAFNVGSFADANAQGHEEAIALEDTPISLGGRPFLTGAVHDGELHDAVMEAPGV